MPTSRRTIFGTATFLLVTLLAWPLAAQAQEPQSEPSTSKWSGSASLYSYFVPDDDDYVQPTVMGDRGWLHLEARYNYEDRETASFWAGYNFSVGKTVTLDVTPMVAAVVGNTDGVAPGYRLSLAYKRLALDSESEYVFNLEESAESFFYNWSEVSVSALDWLRVGLVIQRTRAYESPREVQRGLLAGITYKRLDVTTYVFNPDDDAPLVVVSAGISF